MVSEGCNNRYVVIPPWSNDQIPWNPHNPADVPVPDCAYISGVLVAMERDPAVSGLTFYVTSNLVHLPSYGDDVVAVVLSDEWCRIPNYAFKVRAILKTYGTALPINWGALIRPTPYELAALGQDLRTAIRRLPSLMHAARAYLREIARGRRPTWRIHEIPLGYYRQVSVPFVPLERRRFDVYFAGSTAANRNASAHPLQRFTPKFLSRQNMLAKLRSLAEKRPDLAISTALTAGFIDTTDNEAAQYSQTMMETKICLVPRGTSLETYRYFEGLRFGCVVLCERLPRRWFYDGSPALTVRNWVEIERLIPRLLADNEQLKRLSAASLAWWSQCCSEEAVGTYVAAIVRRNVH